MIRVTTRNALVAIAFAALLAGCASDASKDSATPSNTASDQSGIATSGSDNGTGGSGQNLGANTPDLSQHSIYFSFDKSAIKPEYQSVIDNWSKYLSGNPSVHVQLQGNTDERGSANYNLALGERRARSVQSAMASEGVPSDQTSVISYGKERPVCTQHDESCWAKNRRVDIVQQ
jgi:peptidoglycan-associated lipoprotein